MFWQSKRLIFKCDNSSVVSVLQKKVSENGLLMKLLRRLAIFAIKYNFDYSAIHVEGNVFLKLMLCHVFGFRFSEPYAKTQT